MKLATFTASVMLLSAGYAFAGGGAPVPEKLRGDHPQAARAPSWMMPSVKLFGV
jgi:hypothetical protein